MWLYVISFAVFLLAVLGLGLGRLFGREGIRGSCGGLNGPEGGCGLCGRGAAEAPECPRRAGR